MIIREHKQLIQWDFLERGYAQNLQEIVERKLHGQVLLDDRNERVNRDSHPNLGPHGIFRRTVKRLDPKIIFDPTKEQFDLPAELVEFGDRQGGMKKVVG